MDDTGRRSHDDLETTLIADEETSGRYESMSEDEEDTAGNKTTGSVLTANASYHTAHLGQSSPSPGYLTPDTRMSTDVDQDSSEKWSDAGSFHTPPLSEDEALHEEEPEISVHIPDLSRPLEATVGEGREDVRGEREEQDGDQTEASASRGAEMFVVDQPKLLLHEAPVEPCPEKQPLPPSDTEYPGASPQPSNGKLDETTPLIAATSTPQQHSKQPKESDSSCCSCCVLL